MPADNAVVSALFKSKVTEPKPPLTLILAVPSLAPYVVASVAVTVILNPHAGIMKVSVPLYADELVPAASHTALTL